MSKSEGRSEISNTSVFRGEKRGYPCVIRGVSERSTRGAQNVEIRELSYRARKIRAKSHRIRIVKKAVLWSRATCISWSHVTMCSRDFKKRKRAFHIVKCLFNLFKVRISSINFRNFVRKSSDKVDTGFPELPLKDRNLRNQMKKSCKK